VRRAAALQLSDFAKALGESLTTEDLLPLYRTLLADEQDSVRVNALKSTPAMCKLIGSQRKDVLKDNFKKCVTDKSWRVRVACAEVIADVGTGCGKDEDALAEVKEIYGMLQRDHEAEVRVSTALRSAGAAAVLGADFGKEFIFPILKDLVLDPNTIQRIELAAVLMDTCAPLGKANTLEAVFPTLVSLLEGGEENNNVRLCMIKKLSDLIDVVGTKGVDGVEPNGIVALVSCLSHDKNWRVRHCVLELLPKMAACMDEAEFTTEFAGQEAGWATDNVALMRSDWINTVAKVARDVEGYGGPWLSKHVVPVLEMRKADKSYQQRSVLLYGASTLAPLLGEEELQTKLCPHILEMCDDKVPNLRIDAVKACKGVALRVGADWRNKLVAKLNDKTTDEDPDVAFFANQSLEAIGS